MTDLSYIVGGVDELTFSEEDEANLAKLVLMEKKTREKISQKLEWMSVAQEGLLSICSIEECAKIKISIDEKDNWVGKNDSPLYGSVVNHYKEIGKGNYSNGLSHGLCPEHEAEALREADEYNSGK